jgi:hypothetical protein
VLTAAGPHGAPGEPGDPVADGGPRVEVLLSTYNGERYVDAHIRRSSGRTIQISR